jgi:hypothetical protein
VANSKYWGCQLTSINWCAMMSKKKEDVCLICEFSVLMYRVTSCFYLIWRICQLSQTMHRWRVRWLMKQSWPSRSTEKNHENPRSRWPVFRQKFQLSLSSRSRSRTLPLKHNSRRVVFWKHKITFICTKILKSCSSIHRTQFRRDISGDRWEETNILKTMSFV